MLRSLMSGVSGVRGHQVSLDVVGNNIANVNTAGYKRSSITFQDLLYQNTSGTAAPNEQRGGVNAKQVGLGMQVSAIETIHTQGTTQFTGSRTDFAIQGDGYFVVMDGNSRLFTRAGNYTLDANSNLVQAGTGYRLQGYQMVRDPIDPLQFNQGSSLTDINIPTGQKMEARQTTVVGYRCNLDSRADAFLPMGLLANNFSTTATLKGQKYPVEMEEGTTPDSFMTLRIGNDDLILELSGVDAASGRPLLAASGGFVEIDGTAYTVGFDSATGVLTLTEMVGPGGVPEVWSLDLSKQMDYQSLTIVDGANRYSYLAEFTDVAATGEQTLRLWGTDYKGDMEVFEYDIPLNADGSFDVGTAITLGNFGGGAFVSASNAPGGRGVQLTSSIEIVNASQISDRIGINPTIVQNVGLGGKIYNVSVTEGDPNGGYATLMFVDRDNPNNTGTLQMNYAGLNADGSVKLASSTFVLDGRTYEGVYTAGATDSAGTLVLNQTLPLPAVPGVWSYNLGSRFSVGSTDVAVGSPLDVNLTLPGGGGSVKTEFDSLGGGDYKFTILGAGSGEFLEVRTSNFRQYMGVMPVTSEVVASGTIYNVTPAKGTSANSFMTLNFDGGASVSFSMNGLDSSGRLQFVANDTITLDGETYNLNTVPYDPATGVLTFTNETTPGQDFTYEVGKYVNFQTVTDSKGKSYVVDFYNVAAASGAVNDFALRVWDPGTNVRQVAPGTFAAGELTVGGAAPIAPGSLFFTAGGNTYRDNGSGLIQQDAGAGVWNDIVGSSIDYTTGYINLNDGAFNNAVTSWSSSSGIDAITMIGDFAAGDLPATPFSAPLVPGSLTFTAGGIDFRDDGLGGLEYYNAGTWTPVATGSINYSTGAITGLDHDGATPAAGPVTNWSTTKTSTGTNSFTIPVELGKEQAVATVNQRIANVHNTKLDVYDSLGNPYTLEVSWEKLDNGIWRWRAWLPNGEASLSDNTGLLRFGPDGKLDTNLYNPTPIITVQFDEVGARESQIKLDFSGQSFQKELLDGVTQYGSEFTTKGYYQDGYSMGVLTDFAVAQDGTVNGIYSNGQNIPLYRVALALFANPAGLVKIGNTAFTQSNNSGIAQIGSPQEGGAGSIVGSSLEMSNVDLTEEFTKLITSQRGFQANARIITTSDQVLEELINIKR